jgi:hypothetical protein
MRLARQSTTVPKTSNKRACTASETVISGPFSG